MKSAKGLLIMQFRTHWLLPDLLKVQVIPLFSAWLNGWLTESTSCLIAEHFGETTNLAMLGRISEILLGTNTGNALECN